MSKPRTKAQAKRRRRRSRPLTDDQRLTLELIRLAAIERSLARQDRKDAELRQCIEGEHYGSPRCQRNRLDRWEAAELQRMNEGRTEPLWSLLDSAYEAKHLMRFLAE